MPLTFTPSNLNFGNVVIGGSSTKSVTIKNITTQTVTISSVTGSSYYLVNPSGTSPAAARVLAGKTCTLDRDLQTAGRRQQPGRRYRD